MANETIIIDYVFNPKGLKDAQKEIANTTDLVTELRAETQAAFANRAIDDATKKLEGFNAEIQETSKQFSSAKAELNALTKEITSGKLEGKELAKAKQRAAELTDQIGDAREEIRRMASDTRALDVVVEGVRGVTAAFTLAQGVIATLGSENEDLQKSVLKVQGALSILQSTQELATIATKQGGIVTEITTKAQAAYALVVGNSTGALKAFRLALAATGVGAVVLVISELVQNWDALTASVKRFLGIRIDSTNASTLRKELDQLQSRVTAQNEINEFYAKNEEEARKDRQRLNNGHLTDLALLTQRVNKAHDAREITEEEFISLITDLYAKRNNIIRQRNQEEQHLENEALKAAEEAALKRTEQIMRTIKIQNLDREFLLRMTKQSFVEMVNLKMQAGDALADEPLLVLTPEQVKANEEATKKVANATENMIVGIRAALTPDGVTTKEAIDNFVNEFVSGLEELKPYIDAFSSLVSGIYQTETNALETEKQRQLAIVGNDAKKRERIEKDFAKRRAVIARQQAVLEKSLAIFNITLETAKAVAGYTGKLPLSAPLLALAIATGAAQIAVVASRPLPEIPAFKDGVIDFKGRGTETSDSNLVFLSNRESVMRADVTKNYGDELRALDEDRFENLVFYKYVVPALKAAKEREKIEASEAYDDALLRAEVRRTRDADKSNAKYIVTGIVNGLQQGDYLKQKHG